MSAQPNSRFEEMDPRAVTDDLMQRIADLRLDKMAMPGTYADSENEIARRTRVDFYNALPTTLSPEDVARIGQTVAIAGRAALEASGVAPENETTVAIRFTRWLGENAIGHGGSNVAKSAQKALATYGVRGRMASWSLRAKRIGHALNVFNT